MQSLTHPRKRTVRLTLIVLAWFQAISTVIGWVTLWFTPAMYAPILAGTVFAGEMFLGGALLGIIVGGFQWAALWVTWRHPRWFPLSHLAAGFVMVCWIFGECLVLDSFVWPHALWGGIGVLQITLVAVHLGALRPDSQPGRASRSGKTKDAALPPR